jgi:hypothetical protein
MEIIKNKSFSPVHILTHMNTEQIICNSAYFYKYFVFMFTGDIRNSTCRGHI